MRLGDVVFPLPRRAPSAMRSRKLRREDSSRERKSEFASVATSRENRRRASSGKSVRKIKIGLSVTLWKVTVGEKHPQGTDKIPSKQRQTITAKQTLALQEKCNRLLPFSVDFDSDFEASSFKHDSYLSAIVAMPYTIFNNFRASHYNKSISKSRPKVLREICTIYLPVTPTAKVRNHGSAAPWLRKGLRFFTKGLEGNVVACRQHCK